MAGEIARVCDDAVSLGANVSGALAVELIVLGAPDTLVVIADEFAHVNDRLFAEGRPHRLQGAIDAVAGRQQH